MTFNEKHQSARVYDAWEQQLEQSRGPYLFANLSLADLALVPSVMRLTSHTKDLSHWPAVQRWTHELLSRPTVREWLAVANAQPIVWYSAYLP
jgi:glutathione S-transferase